METTDFLLIDDFPQLRWIAWSIPHEQTISESNAFSLYRENWRFVDEGTMTDSERALVERLRMKFGHGEKFEDHPARRLKIGGKS